MTPQERHDAAAQANRHTRTVIAAMRVADPVRLATAREVALAETRATTAALDAVLRHLTGSRKAVAP